MFFKRIQAEIEKILKKNQNGFPINRSLNSQILTIYRVIEVVRAKRFKVTLLFVDFLKAFDSIHWGKMDKCY